MQTIAEARARALGNCRRLGAPRQSAGAPWGSAAVPACVPGCRPWWYVGLCGCMHMDVSYQREGRAGFPPGSLPHAQAGTKVPRKVSASPRIPPGLRHGQVSDNPPAKSDCQSARVCGLHSTPPACALHLGCSRHFPTPAPQKNVTSGIGEMPCSCCMELHGLYGFFVCAYVS